MKDTLVIVPCAKQKIWDKWPNHGPTPARDAYTSGMFALNRSYAERFGESWVILSAKYGLVSPGFVITGPYDITFKDRATNPVPVSTLRRQIQEQRLDRFGTVIGLGGMDYRVAIEAAFTGTRVVLKFPFSGLSSQGEMMSVTKRAVQLGKPLPVVENMETARAIATTSADVIPRTERNSAPQTQNGSPAREDFQRALRSIWARAEGTGKRSVDVQSGELHRQVGGYPGTNHRMPICREAMYDAMKPGDEVLESPPKGKGATVLIRYQLPR